MGIKCDARIRTRSSNVMWSTRNATLSANNEATTEIDWGGRGSMETLRYTGGKIERERGG